MFSEVLDWDDPNLIVDPTALVAEYQTPKSLFDDFTTPVFDIAVDYRDGDKAIIYVAERRIGVRLLEFDVSVSPVTLTEMTARIQTPHYTSGVHVRVNADGTTRNLVVNDSAGGIHVYE